VSPRQPEATRAIYVRLPLPEADRLDRVVEQTRSSKRHVIAALLAKHLDPDASDEVVGRPRRVVIEDQPDGLTVGHAAFRPTAPAEVLTADEAAELLRVGVDVVLAMAEAGEVPARRLGEEWRFRREGLLDWLAAS
jgi:excisionase family DNA binding protein